MVRKTVPAVLDDLRNRGLLFIVDDICRLRGVTPTELCGRARSRAVVHARHELWWRIREHPERSYSFPEIARLFDRDHSTILDGVAAHRRRVANRH